MTSICIYLNQFYTLNFAIIILNIQMHIAYIYYIYIYIYIRNYLYLAINYKAAILPNRIPIISSIKYQLLNTKLLGNYFTIPIL